MISLAESKIEKYYIVKWMLGIDESIKKLLSFAEEDIIHIIQNQNGHIMIRSLKNEKIISIGDEISRKIRVAEVV